MKKYEPLSPLEPLILAAMRIEHLGTKHLFGPLGLTSSSVKMLRLLECRGSASPGDMLAVLGTTKSNMSQRLAFLEKEGLICRNYGKNAKDKRRATVALTTEGKKKLAAVRKRLLKGRTELMKEFSRKELEDFNLFITKLNRILDGADETLPRLLK
ncbi:MAG TPA: MarR family transcriptional regulator [Candidatus Moranbacteria bacterium]|nr:MarR family transcriptional regulator [Candidatus Moranbacteria bacterium]